jgi:hypothetical protein
MGFTEVDMGAIFSRVAMLQAMTLDVSGTDGIVCIAVDHDITVAGAQRQGESGLSIDCAEFNNLDSYTLSCLMVLLARPESLIFIDTLGLPHTFYPVGKVTHFTVANPGPDFARIYAGMAGFVLKTTNYRVALTRLISRVVRNLMQACHLLDEETAKFLLCNGLSGLFSMAIVTPFGNRIYDHFIEALPVSDYEESTLKCLNACIHNRHISSGGVFNVDKLNKLYGRYLNTVQAFIINKKISLNNDTETAQYSNFQAIVRKITVAMLDKHGCVILWCGGYFPHIYPGELSLKKIQVTTDGQSDILFKFNFLEGDVSNMILFDFLSSLLGPNCELIVGSPLPGGIGAHNYTVASTLIMSINGLHYDNKVVNIFRCQSMLRLFAMGEVGLRISITEWYARHRMTKTRQTSNGLTSQPIFGNDFSKLSNAMGLIVSGHLESSNKRVQDGEDIFK